MIDLKDIVKIYRTGGEELTALKKSPFTFKKANSLQSWVLVVLVNQR